MSTKCSSQKDAAMRQTRDLLRLQRKALTTERTYLHWLGSYIDWLCAYGRDLADSRARLEAYLTSLANRGCSASTQN